MSALPSLLLTYALNAVWQVPLVLGAATLAARALRHHRSLAIYRLWVGALGAQVLLPAVSTGAGPLRQLFTRIFLHQASASSAGITVTFSSSEAFGRVPLSPALVTLLASLYGLTLVYATARLGLVLLRTLRLTVDAVEIAPPHPHATLWAQSREHCGAPAARLFEAPRVRVPLTLGTARPSVLLPPGLLQQLSATDLQTLFAHECTHIRRQDFAWNLALQLLALPLAFHPLLRRTQDQLAESREWVCDDLAAAAVGTRHSYAHSLLRLATQLLPAPSVRPTHAIGMLDANAFERRLMHLTKRSKSESTFQRTAALAFCGLLGALSCGSAWAWRTGIPSTAVQQASDQPVRISGGVMAGLVLTRVDPVYPPEARAQGVQGSVVLSATISDEGTVEQLTVISGPQALQAAAINAVRQWTYKPFQLNGKPTAVSTTITINFKL